MIFRVAMNNLKIEPLRRADVDFVKASIFQIVIVYLFVFVIGSLFYGVGFYVILSKNHESFKNVYILVSYSFLVYGVFFGVVYYQFRKPLRDLKNGMKHVLKGVIEHKIDNTNYGFTSNPGIDIQTQSMLIEYSIIVNNVTYYIEKEQYEEFNIGDKVCVSKTILSNIFIGID